MKRKENKGITLIALVITIIVLLILAGVAIATLTGENGILTKANQAKTETTKKSAEEKVEIAVLGSYGKDGRLDYEALRKNLDKVEGIDKGTIPNPITGESFPFTVAVDGTDLEIKVNGEVSLPFNAEEWDKTATDEDGFVWGSDTEGEEGYDIIVGYTQKIDGYTKLKFPSRCKKIQIGNAYSNTGDGNSRSFASNVKTIEIPNTVIEIGSFSFAAGYNQTGFINLENVIIPNSVIKIGNEAFERCQNLTNVTIPNSIEEIGDRAFIYCNNIKDITIPNSVSYMGTQVFFYWDSSQTINIKGYSSVPLGWNYNWNKDCSAIINWNQ